MNILLVEPNFPVPPKSKNYRYYFPISLLKLASYHRHQGHKVRLVRGERRLRSFIPDKVLITSLFTYWSEYVHTSVKFYKKHFPNAKVVVGGIYATLMPDHCKSSGCDEVFFSLHEEADAFPPAYDLVPEIDFQVLHAMRGCIRRCSFCGVWKIEPEIYKPSIREEIVKRKLLFFDNNFLANPHVEEILTELADMKRSGEILSCEAQSGFDYRLLKPKLATLLKQANFTDVRIAWDHSFRQSKSVKKGLDILFEAGFSLKSMQVFMIYNYAVPFSEMIKKLQKCFEWKIQVADCRFRPLNQTYDHYNPRAYKTGQTDKDYYIHPKWSDEEVRSFRRMVRQQNICIRYNIDPKDYNPRLERFSRDKKEEIIKNHFPSNNSNKKLSKRTLKKINKAFLEGREKKC